MRGRARPRRRQRGVALLIALILVALATLLATKLSFDGWLERRRTIGVLAAEQALHFAMGAEALAGVLLAQTPSTETNLAQPWAQPTAPLPLTPDENPEGEPIGMLQGSLEDMEGRFNLNNLARKSAPDGPEDLEVLRQFQRLLSLVGLEPKWAGIARDWIDEDGIPGNPDGAEDAIYTAQTPPYRTGNWPMTSPTELMNMPGFGADRYRKIAPYVTALPATNSKINICTAPGPVLESLADNLSGEFKDPKVLALNRKAGCFPTPAILGNILGKSASTATPYKESTDYFRLTTRVTLGTTQFTLYSLLYRSGGKLTPLLRTFGTP
ncbi:MAG: type II secretion system minor pseudopilin GspK [Pseudomonadota bacterium]|nr:type II secretion system minor pseudopilin GspK [Pseudomonadota bacterium]